MIQNELLEAALSYAELGFKVFPLLPGSKEPATENGLLNATTDQALIEEAWSNQPFNIGISTAGLLVIDIDGAGNPWLSTLGERIYDLVGCPMSRTPRGGSHRFFRQPPGTWRNTASKLAPGVDTRADGGYVVAPPSVLETGGGYQWLEETELTADLPLPPEWLVKKLQADQPASATKILISGNNSSNPIPQGQRNHALASIAGAMRRYGLSRAEIVASLHVVNCSRCQPPMAANEVEKIADSITRYTPDQFATGAVEGDFYGLDGAKQAQPFPEDLLKPPGLISEIIDYNLAGAIRQQPILALAGAIALMATITGRKVQDEFGTRTNLFILGVAGSGQGKERARTVNKELLFKAKAEHLIGPESPASASGLVSCVANSPAVLLQWDEIGRLFQAINGRNAGAHLAGISTTLMKLFTSSNTMFFGDAYADSKKNRAIDQPHAVLYGTTVPVNLYCNMTEESIVDGFMGRLLIFESETHAAEYCDPRFMDPEPIVALIREWIERPTCGNLTSEHPAPDVMPSGPGVRAAWKRMQDECLERERQAEEHSALWTRAVEKARKLALIHACSRGVQEVGIPDVEWGQRLSIHLTQRLSFAGESHIAKSHADRNRQEIVNWLRNRPLQTATVRELARAVRRQGKRERDEAIRELEEMGYLVCWEEQITGRPTKKIRAVSGLVTTQNESSGGVSETSNALAESISA